METDPPHSLVLFDFDGTLTKRDTLFEFIKFSKGNFVFYWGIFQLFPYFIRFILKKISAKELKEKLLIFYFQNYDIDLWITKGRDFSKKKIPGLLRKHALEKLNLHKLENSRIIVVSASFENWIAPWCEQMEIENITTQLEFIEGKLTGRIHGENCNGIEKIKRIKEQLNLQSYMPIYAYGNSNGDREMLSIANYQFYKKF